MTFGVLVIPEAGRMSRRIMELLPLHLELDLQRYLVPLLKYTLYILSPSSDYDLSFLFVIVMTFV